MSDPDDPGEPGHDDTSTERQVTANQIATAYAEELLAQAEEGERRLLDERGQPDLATMYDAHGPTDYHGAAVHLDTTIYGTEAHVLLDLIHDRLADAEDLGVIVALSNLQVALLSTIPTGLSGRAVVMREQLLQQQAEAEAEADDTDDAPEPRELEPGGEPAITRIDP